MKLLIFDIDGTLTDTNEVDTECYVNAFQDEFGVELENIDWSTFQNVTDLGLFIELFAQNFSTQPKFAQLKNLRERFFSYLEKSLGENPKRFAEITGAKEFVEFCKENDEVEIAFATGGWSESAKLKLQAANISVDDLPFSSSDFFISRQDILKDAIQQSSNRYDSKEFSDTVYLGDGVWDFWTTAELKIKFIGVDSKNDGKLERLGAKHLISDFAEISHVFEILESL